MTRVAIRPEMLRWASERSRIDEIALRARCPRLLVWERGEKQPTFKDLEGFMSNGASIIATGEVCE